MCPETSPLLLQPIAGPLDKAGEVPFGLDVLFSSWIFSQIGDWAPTWVPASSQQQGLRPTSFPWPSFLSSSWMAGGDRKKRELSWQWHLTVCLHGSKGEAWMTLKERLSLIPHDFSEVAWWTGQGNHWKICITQMIQKTIFIEGVLLYYLTQFF